jgi:DNA-binding MarR family transcriptional regulator
MGAVPTSKRDRAAQERREQRLLELGAAFRTMFRALNRVRGRDTHLAPGELSHAQFELLVELYDRGELPAGELAAAAQLSPATVTPMLDHLAASGHVERLRSQADRRVVVTRLTAQGRRRVEAKRKGWKQRWEAAVEDLEDGQLEAATEVLRRLAGVFDEKAAEAAREGPETPAQATSQRPGA